MTIRAKLTWSSAVIAVAALMAPATKAKAESKVNDPVE
jgi:hypothetical protein